MSEVLNCINERMKELNNIIVEKQVALKNVPEGALKICKTPKRTQFYIKTKELDEDGKEINNCKFIKKSEEELVRTLCQKDYDQRVLRSAQNELKQLERLKKNYPDIIPESIYKNMNEERKKYTAPIKLPDDQYIAEWKSIMYERKGFSKDCPELFADTGERVRSKSEILIANALNKFKVPYHYEKPLYLKGYGLIHPDFTILNKRLRKEIYWEHLGKMDDVGYVDDNIRRILMYEKNGYYLGDKLILTFETQKIPLNSLEIDRMIQKYLL